MRLGRNAVLAAAVAGFGLSVSAKAATITWSGATTDSADTDVVNNGTSVSAYTFVTGNTTTVNGVTFTPYENQSSDKLTGLGGTYGGYGGFTGQSGAYTDLTTGSYWQDGGSGTFTYNNLTVGDKYEVQLWVQDARSCCGGGRTGTFTNGNSVTLIFNTTGADGGAGQYAVGTFTADATSEAIAITANSSAQLNGIQLRLVPEPASLGLLGIGGLSLLARRRRA